MSKPPTSKPPTAKAKPKGKPGGLVKPPTTPSTRRPTHVPKTFSIERYDDSSEGVKATVYSRSGGGKTSLAAMLTDSAWFTTDDGARKIVNPFTGEKVNRVKGIETFQDIRDSLNQDGLWKNIKYIVVDTLTRFDELVQNHILDTVTINGQRANSFRKYGWDGERHLLDQYRLLLTDFDAHIRAGRNIILLCQQAQITVANSEGADYLEDGPKLQHRKDCSVRTEVVEWCDHVARIGFLDFEVQKDDAKARAGKVVAGDSTRAIFAGGAQHFIAKSRPISGGDSLPPIISFESPSDDSLWQLLFPE